MQIAASIASFGFNNPILVDTQHGIIAGHGRLLAARKLQLEQVPVIVLDHLSEAQKRGYILPDNKFAQNAGWDEELLRCELAALEAEDFNLDVIGFDDEELARLLADQEVQGLTDEDAIPEVPERPVSAAGDLWLLGNHKLLVGDATRREDVDRLMAGDRADLIFTDPPYNVDYAGYTDDRLTIPGDRLTAEEFQKFLLTVCQHYRQIAKLGASLYMCHASSWQRKFQDALEQAGFQVRCQIIWAKNTFAWGFGRYKFQHEPLFYAHVAGQKDPWYGDKSQSTLWPENKPAALYLTRNGRSELHLPLKLAPSESHAPSSLRGPDDLPTRQLTRRGNGARQIQAEIRHIGNGCPGRQTQCARTSLIL